MGAAKSPMETARLKAKPGTHHGNVRVGAVHDPLKLIQHNVDSKELRQGAREAGRSAKKGSRVSGDKWPL
jgi:hypothetical protein